MSSNFRPSERELRRAAEILTDVHVEPGLALDRVALFLTDEADRIVRNRKLMEIMLRVGDHCTIAQARIIMEKENGK